MQETLGLIPGSGRFTGEGIVYLFQYSCLEYPHGQRGVESYSPRSHKKAEMTEQLSTAQHTGVQDDFRGLTATLLESRKTLTKMQRRTIPGELFKEM